jgi:hypothetical protein
VLYHSLLFKIYTEYPMPKTSPRIDELIKEVIPRLNGLIERLDQAERKIDRCEDLLNLKKEMTDRVRNDENLTQVQKTVALLENINVREPIEEGINKLFISSFGSSVRSAKRSIETIVRKLDFGDFFFVSIDQGENLKESNLRSISKKYKNMPILIRRASNNLSGYTFSMYGLLNKEWRITDFQPEDNDILNEALEVLSFDNVKPVKRYGKLFSIVSDYNESIAPRVKEILQKYHKHSDNYNYDHHSECEEISDDICHEKRERGLFLMSIDDEKSTQINWDNVPIISNNSPVLIKISSATRSEFIIVGCIDGEWKRTKVIGVNELNTLPFKKNELVKVDNRSLTYDITRIIKQGHNTYQDPVLLPLKKAVDKELDYIRQSYPPLSLQKFRDKCKSFFYWSLAIIGAGAGLAAQGLLIIMLPAILTAPWGPLLAIALGIITFVGLKAMEEENPVLSILCTLPVVAGAYIGSVLGRGIGWVVGTMANMAAQLFPKPELQPMEVNSLVDGLAGAASTAGIFVGLNPQGLTMPLRQVNDRAALEESKPAPAAPRTQQHPQIVPEVEVTSGQSAEDELRPLLPPRRSITG